MAKLIPIKASRFVEAPVDLQDICLANGMVPTNDVFFPHWYNQSDIILLYGGFGSGKSNFAADRLLDKCMNQPYFKCIYGRKVKDTVRESVFAMLCDRIEDLGLQDEFNYSRAGTSSMVIRHWKTGNVFLPFGADNIKKLKSLKDPTDILCDEFDQFDFIDFKELWPRLRVAGVKCQFWGLFNTVDVNKTHWLYDMFFNPKKPFIEKLRELVPGATTELLTVFCNYTDNYFIDRKLYEEKLWGSAGFDPVRFRQIAKGEWGSSDMTNKYAWAYDEEVHVVDVTTAEGRLLMTIDPRIPVYVSFDFNVDPMTAIVFQTDRKTWLKVYFEFRLRNSDIYEMTERIKVDLAGYFLVITGDATGKARNGNVRGKKSYIDTLRSELKLNGPRVQFPSKNPSFFDARLVLNAVLRKIKVLISSECQFLRNDLHTITVNEAGVIDKKKQEALLKNHLLDTFKYACWNYLKQIVKLMAGQSTPE